jgi:two-component system, OmpR family, KDP operon response regulator KdpE
MLPLIYDDSHVEPCLPFLLKQDRNITRTSGNKILVIDDDRMLCRGIDARLKFDNYNPCFAHDGSSGLSTALAEMPNLVILDLGLPSVRDGYWVMQSFKDFPGLADVPVIVLTALGGFTHQMRCRDAGAKRFFQKPVTIHDLMTSIQQLVG